MRLSTCLILSALLAAPLACAQSMYQWKDAQGVTHYSDVPPPKSKLEGKPINAADAMARGSTPATAQAAPAESAQCSSARLNQKILSGAAPVRQMGADGKPGAVLSDAQRASQRELADAAVKAYCTPADAGR
ncbi:DUF4124 domain-containing protein [Pseudoxanthomonas spadix]|jgi:hypothetical protein|uniref:DUF4124 domain-containing protein n=1 Tax=Pseudoxanthomonas spadix TaxID=415229 RepID=UPI000EFF77BA|nr:DUF4124 domain-containing protein [Pseudoxanthomonas spadix]MBP3973942.1 DUF4124 domain-containing protein [Pseudoxanthomonas spadix]RMW91899.1 DUF4124 domain-containing protein [Pseudoxanthomonas spadix]